MASYQQRNKKWSVRFRYINNGEEIQKRLSGFDKKSEAQQAFIKFMQEYKTGIIQGEKKINGNITFNDIFEDYKKMALVNIKESTYLANIKLLKLHALSFFDKMKIELINTKEILKWKEYILSKNFSDGHNECIYHTLSALFTFAEKMYDIKHPLRKVGAFKKNNNKTKLNYWTVSDFKQFIDTLDNLEFKTFFSFLYFTGSRKGEALGIKYKSLFLKEKYVLIENNVTYRNLQGTGLRDTTTKTKQSNRKIELNNNLCTLLENYIKDKEITETDYLFGGKKPFAFETVRRTFVHYIAISKVKYITVHGLRHSHASLLINTGTNPLATMYIIAERLGNSVEQIQKTYGHMFPSEQKKLIEELDKI